MSNWNVVLSSTRNLNDVLIVLQKVLALLQNKADVTTIDEALDSLATLDQQAADSIREMTNRLNQFANDADTATNEAIMRATVRGFATEQILKQWTPDFNGARAKADDTKKIWRWELTSAASVTPITGNWVDTGLSELDQAISHTDEKVAALITVSKNLFNKQNKQLNKYIANTGLIRDAANWSCSEFIKVQSNQNYTISASQRRVGLAFYDINKQYIADTYNALAANVTVQAPLNAAYLVINVDSDSISASNVQVEIGSTATAYEDYKKTLKSDLLPSELNPDVLVAKTELEVLVKPLTIKDYEIEIASKNLFDESKIQHGKYLNNSGRVMTAEGWGCSGYIPVITGQKITISGTKGRAGTAFYVNNTDTDAIPDSYIAATSLPATITVPTGANFLITNLYSATVPSYSNVQVEIGSTATSYEPYGVQRKIDASFINFETQASINTLKISGNEIKISGRIDDVPISIDAVLTKVNEAGDSTVFNFTKDIVNSVVQRTLSDDVAPMRLDGATIGANHGYQKSNVTLAGHGKTVADIGSVWTGGGKQYVIVGIISNDVLSITSRADNSAFVLAELTHVSGASNTASFTPTATISTQWYPAIRDRKLTCFVDNVKIDLTQDATHNFKNTVKFLESYSIMKKSDIVEWLIANKGVNHENYDAVPCYTVNFGYTFDHECGCTIYFGGVGRKTVDLADQMITQSVQLAQGNGTVYNYIPKTVEFTAGGFTYNFSQLENLYSKNPSTALYLTAARQEASVNPIDRIVMLNDQVGYATGYLPVLDAAPAVRSTNASNKYLEIRNGTLKLYPRLIDSNSINKINDGDAFAAIAYRKYFKRSTDCTCNYVVRSEIGDYLYLDWHTAKTDEIELQSDLVGREFEIVEKSSNVTLLSKFASNSILVKIDATKNYGYLVLKFK